MQSLWSFDVLVASAIFDSCFFQKWLPSPPSQRRYSVQFSSSTFLYPVVNPQWSWWYKLYVHCNLRSILLKNFLFYLAAVNSDDKDKNLASFWVPSLTPQAKPTLLKKPDTKTYCPMSGKQLRIKDLIPVKLTAIDDGDDRPMVAKSERYKCAVTHDALGNSVPCAVLKNTGHVVTMDCIERLIKKDMLCPFTGAKLKESDIIPLQRGGTGFAGSGVQLEAKKAGPVLQA